MSGTPQIRPDDHAGRVQVVALHGVDRADLIDRSDGIDPVLVGAVAAHPLAVELGRREVVRAHALRAVDAWSFGAFLNAFFMDWRSDCWGITSAIFRSAGSSWFSGVKNSANNESGSSGIRAPCPRNSWRVPHVICRVAGVAASKDRRSITRELGENAQSLTLCGSRISPVKPPADSVHFPLGRRCPRPSRWVPHDPQRISHEEAQQRERSVPHPHTPRCRSAQGSSAHHRKLAHSFLRACHSGAARKHLGGRRGRARGA